MNRNKKLLLNSSFGLIKQLITVICGFILPRYMLLYYGSNTNGLVSSITNFLGFISLLEMGIGPVIQANLYKPLAEKDNHKISELLVSSERFFKRIAYIFLGYIMVLFIVFPLFINTSYDAIFSISLIAIISISTFAQYYFGITYQILLNADQKSYVQTSMQIITIVANTVLCVVLMKIGATIHIVKLVSSIVFILRPIGQIIYVNKHYNLNMEVHITEEPIKQKWNGFAQHFAAVICGNTDVTILTFFSTLANVSVYTVYYNVTNGVTNIIMTAATGLEAYFGNIIAKNENDTLEKSFSFIEWLIHTIVTIIFTITSVMIVPFICIYTRGVSDANYILPLFGVILVLAYCAQCLRIPYFRIIKAAGHFKQTQNGSFISAALNIVISIVLVFRLGLVGIAIGTFAAMFYHTCYFVWYLKYNIVNRPIWYYIKQMSVDIIVFVLAYKVTKTFSMTNETYFSWAVLACKVSFVTILISAAVNAILNIKILIKWEKRH